MGGYQSYVDFKNRWSPIGADASLLTSVIRNGAPSIVKRAGLPEGYELRSVVPDIEKDTGFLDELRKMFFAMQDSFSKDIKNNSSNGITNISPESLDAALEFRNKIAELNEVARSPKLMGISANLEKLGNTASTETLRLMLGRTYRPFVTGIGDTAENLMRIAVGSPQFLSAIKSNLEPKIGEILSSAARKPSFQASEGIRAEVRYERTIKEKEGSLTYEAAAGTPLTDIVLSLTGGDGKPIQGAFNISVKQSAGKVSAAEIRALTTTWGKLLSTEDFESGDPYFWWSFNRIAGQLAGTNTAVKEVKNYVAGKNVLEATFGAGTKADKIGDFIIDGRLFSKTYYIQCLRDELTHNTRTKFYRLEGKLAQDDLVSKIGTIAQKEGLSREDAAVRTYIQSKDVATMLSTKMVLHVGVPAALHK